MRFAISGRLLVMAILTVLVIADPALAADEAHGEKKGNVGFAGLRYDLGIYTLIVFGILIFVLRKYAWPHIKTGLEKREVNIRGALDEAKATLAEAKKERDEAKRQLLETAGQVK